MKRSPLISNVHIFILLVLFTNLNSNINRFCPIGANAGKSKSSKTTVIAIDGGGGHGKAHPVPVPWPVVHCHHHHHHLKYVPKPVLVHHWVKKLKPYEIEANNEHPSYEQRGAPMLSEYNQGVEMASNTQDYHLPVSETELAFNMMSGSRMVSSSDQHIEEQQPIQHMNKFDSGPSYKIAENEANKTKLGNIAETILLKGAGDQSYHENLKSLNGAHSRNEQDGKTSASSLRSSGKPNHPFDEPHDQIEDESRSPLLNGLKIANAQEEAKAINIYDKLAKNQHDRVRAMRAANLMLAAMQQARQTPSAHKVAGNALNIVRHSPSLIASPAIRPRMANVIHESNTIHMMTKLAEQVAQLEARKLIGKQQQQARKLQNSTTKASTSRSRRLFRSADVFNIFNLNRLNKERRRVSNHAISYPLNHAVGRYFRPQMNHLYNGPALDSSNRLRQLVEPVSAQASSISNKVVDPHEAAPDIKRNPKSTIVGATPTSSNSTALASSNATSATTLLDKDQERKFYQSQREHLNEAHQYVVNDQIIHAEPMKGLEIGPKVNRTTIAGQFSQEPSNFQNSIMKAPQNFSIAGHGFQKTEENNYPVPSDLSSFGLSNSGALMSRPQASGMEVTFARMQAGLETGNEPFFEMVQNPYGPRPAESAAPLSSYLEFPLSPQQWSSEALRSINSDLQENQADADASEEHQSGDSIHDSNNLNQGASPSSFAKGGSLDQSFTYDFSPQKSSTFNNAVAQTPLWYNSGQHGPMMVAASGYPIQFGRHLQVFGQTELPYANKAFNQNLNSQLSSSSSFVPTYTAYGPQLDTNQDRSRVVASSSGLEHVLSPADARGQTESMAASALSPISGRQAFNKFNTPGFTQTGPLSPWNSALSNIDPLNTATNDMNQLRQLHNSISQSAAGANNLTAMARLSQQLRDQMKTLQQRLPQMPNIPQPPQIPNLPMPPPGMMQMAGLALPFAMARATRNQRNRNQQVNSAANGGGSSGSRFLQNAAAVTRRLTRPRRRPTSRPVNAQRPGQDRRRFLGIVQTVVDLRRRPPSPNNHRFPSASALTLSSAKIKPKIDSLFDGNTRRHQRSLDTVKYETETESSDYPSDMVPSSNLISMPDGSLTKFQSMTSPMTTIAQHLNQRRQQLLKLSESVQQEISDSHGVMVGQSTPSEHQSQHTASQMLPVPLVANHINLLLFAQNVTTESRKGQDREGQENNTPQDVSNQIPAGVSEGQDGLDGRLAEQQDGSTDSQALQDHTRANNVSPTTLDQTAESKTEEGKPVVNTEQLSNSSTSLANGKVDMFVSSDVVQRGEASSLSPVLNIHDVFNRPMVRVPFAKSTSYPTPMETTNSGLIVTSAQSSGPRLVSRFETEKIHSMTPQHFSLLRGSSNKPSLSKSTPVASSTTHMTSTSRATSPMTTSSPRWTASFELPVETEKPLSADYIRAIKLVRGVAYPWPPPTQSSKLST